MIFSFRFMAVEGLICKDVPTLTEPLFHPDDQVVSFAESEILWSISVRSFGCITTASSNPDTN